MPEVSFEKSKARLLFDLVFLPALKSIIKELARRLGVAFPLGIDLEDLCALIDSGFCLRIEEEACKKIGLLPKIQVDNIAVLKPFSIIWILCYNKSNHPDLAPGTIEAENWQVSEICYDSIHTYRSLANFSDLRGLAYMDMIPTPTSHSLSWNGKDFGDDLVKVIDCSSLGPSASSPTISLSSETVSSPIFPDREKRDDLYRRDQEHLFGRSPEHSDWWGEIIASWRSSLPVILSGAVKPVWGENLDMERLKQIFGLCHKKGIELQQAGKPNWGKIWATCTRLLTESAINAANERFYHFDIDFASLIFSRNLDFVESYTKQRFSLLSDKSKENVVNIAIFSQLSKFFIFVLTVLSEPQIYAYRHEARYFFDASNLCIQPFRDYYSFTLCDAIAENIPAELGSQVLEPIQEHLSSDGVSGLLQLVGLFWRNFDSGDNLLDPMQLRRPYYTRLLFEQVARLAKRGHTIAVKIMEPYHGLIPVNETDEGKLKYFDIDPFMKEAFQETLTGMNRRSSSPARLKPQRHSNDNLPSELRGLTYPLPWPIRMPRLHIWHLHGETFTKNRYSYYHKGIDILAVRGSPVRPVCDGIVFWLQKDWVGQTVYIRSDSGLIHAYAHLKESEGAPMLGLGQTVTTRDIIGEVELYPDEMSIFGSPERVYPENVFEEARPDHLHFQCWYAWPSLSDSEVIRFLSGNLPLYYGSEIDPLLLLRDNRNNQISGSCFYLSSSPASGEESYILNFRRKLRMENPQLSGFFSEDELNILQLQVVSEHSAWGVIYKDPSAVDIFYKVARQERIIDGTAISSNRKIIHEAKVFAYLNNSGMMTAIPELLNIGVMAESNKSKVRVWMRLRSLPDAQQIDSYIWQSFSFDEKINIFIAIAEALWCAHELRLVHKDVRPANVLINPSGQVMLIDFGSACSIEDDLPCATDSPCAFGESKWPPSIDIYDSLPPYKRAIDVMALFRPEDEPITRFAQLLLKDDDRRLVLLGGIVLRDMLCGRLDFGFDAAILEDLREGRKDFTFTPEGKIRLVDLVPGSLEAQSARLSALRMMFTSALYDSNALDNESIGGLGRRYFALLGSGEAIPPAEEIGRILRIMYARHTCSEKLIYNRRNNEILGALLLVASMQPDRRETTGKTSSPVNNVFSRKEILDVVSELLSKLGPITLEHILRVTALSDWIAVKLGLTYGDREKILLSSLLHDIGKAESGIKELVEMGREIRFNEVERLMMRRHTLLGEQLLRDCGFFDESILSAVRSHHERYFDPERPGYPDNLSREGIPYFARLITFADVLEAMTSPLRKFPDRKTIEEVLQDYRARKGIKYDPGMAASVIELFEEKLEAEGEAAIIAELDKEAGNLKKVLGISSSPMNREKDYYSIIRNLRDSKRQDEVGLLLLRLLNEGDVDSLGEAIDAAIYFADDPSQGPCCVNHPLENAILFACGQDERLIEHLTMRIGLLIQNRGVNDLLKNAIIDIVIKLSWLSGKKVAQEHFLRRLVSRIGYDELCKILRECLRINKEMVPEQFGTSLPGTDIFLAGGFIMRALDKYRYFLESAGRPVGFAEMYLPTLGKVMLFSIRIFEKQDVGRGIGTKVVWWAAHKTGPGNTVLFTFPVADPQINLFLRCQKRGIFDRVEAVSLPVADATEISERKAQWVPIHCHRDAKALRAAGKNMFIRGIVNPVISPEVRRSPPCGSSPAAQSSSPVNKDKTEKQVALLIKFLVQTEKRLENWPSLYRDCVAAFRGGVEAGALNPVTKRGALGGVVIERSVKGESNLAKRLLLDLPTFMRMVSKGMANPI
ncbi:MAG: HD domain-containing phosphohydrolase, partial [Candidatus Omnitrophota bacterium]